MNVAIIPARAGSKRIPNKNIKDFLGSPLISYSISAAKKSKIFDKIIVSTDSEQIKEIALRYGAEVPFLRSKKNSDDHASTADVLVEVLQKLNSSGLTIKNFCCIYPTAPFLTDKKLIDSFKLFSSSSQKKLFSICRYSYPIQRALKKDGGSLLKMFWPENLNLRSQDLEPAYHDAGQFYWSEVNEFMKTSSLISGDVIGYELCELEVQDIDNLTDWKLAEIKYKYFSGVM